jgi:hypothetical protein
MEVLTNVSKTAPLELAASRARYLDGTFNGDARHWLDAI